MDRAAARAPLAMPGAIFAFLTALVVTVFGVVPSSAAPARQPTGSGDAAAAAAGDTDAGVSVSIAAPDDKEENVQVPGPAAAPAAELPDVPTHLFFVPVPPAGQIEIRSPDATRGRAPPRE